MDDDIPLADGSPILERNSSQSAITPPQKFSIVDVLAGKTGENDIKPIDFAPDSEHSDMFECNEQSIIERLHDLYPYVDLQKLPRQWSMSDRCVGGDRFQPVLELSTDFLRVTKKAPSVKGESTHKDAAAVRANRPVPRSAIVYYFEIKVANKGAECRMGVGLSEKSVSVNRLPGWEPVSYGYHGDDGHYFQSCGKGIDYGPTYTTGDIIGCGLNFVTREIFFTKNGKHLGIAGTNVPIVADLYPTMGMQSFGEMVDVNFGQKPFCYDIKQELEAAELKVSSSVKDLELPVEKTIWMNRIISNWLAHEGYSRVLDSFQRANAVGVYSNVTTKSIVKSESGATLSLASTKSQTSSKSSGSSCRSAQKNSSPPGFQHSNDNSEAAVAAAAATVAANIVAAAIGNTTTRRSVVRSVQEAIHEEMDDRRCIIKRVQQGNTAGAIEKLEQAYPGLLESNKQLALLLKIQQFLEMIEKNSKNEAQMNSLKNDTLPSTSKSCDATTSTTNTTNTVRSSTKRGASEITESIHCNLKRRSSGDSITAETQNSNQSECLSVSIRNGTSMHECEAQQNGNQLPLLPLPQLSALDEMMELSGGGDSNSLPPLSMSPTAMNGNFATISPAATNGSSFHDSVIMAPHTTSTTIIEEDDLTESVTVDELDLDIDTHDELMDHDYGGFTSAEEKAHFESYAKLIEFAQSVSQFSINCGSLICPVLRQRMHDAFSLICYPSPWQSEKSFLFSKSEKEFVAKALNAAILEMLGKDSISPLDKYIRQGKLYREQALNYSASSLLTRLFL